MISAASLDGRSGKWAPGGPETTVTAQLTDIEEEIRDPSGIRTFPARFDANRGTTTHSARWQIG